MADYTKQVKEILKENGCAFVRYGKGDHERWYSPKKSRTGVIILWT